MDLDKRAGELLLAMANAPTDDLRRVVREALEQAFREGGKDG